MKTVKEVLEVTEKEIENSRNLAKNVNERIAHILERNPFRLSEDEPEFNRCLYLIRYHDTTIQCWLWLRYCIEHVNAGDRNEKVEVKETLKETKIRIKEKMSELMLNKDDEAKKSAYEGFLHKI